MNLFFSALFCIFFSSFALAESPVNESLKNLSVSAGCENPYLENTAQLKTYVEECLCEFEARQKCRRPFIFWDCSKTISSHWIPFSKGITIGRKSFKTFNKAEIKALLASSFQTYGPVKPYLVWILPACIASGLICGITAVVPPVILSLPFIWLAFVAKVCNSPLCSSDNKSVELYANEAALLSALQKAKEQEVFIRKFEFFFAGHDDIPDCLNCWSSYNTRIKELKHASFFKLKEKVLQETIGLEKELLFSAGTIHAPRALLA